MLSVAVENLVTGNGLEKRDRSFQKRGRLEKSREFHSVAAFIANSLLITEETSYLAFILLAS